MRSGKARVACTVAVSVTLGALPARADDNAKFKLDTAQVQVATTDAVIKTAIVWDSDGSNYSGWLIGGTLKLAASSVDGTAEARLDDYTKDWRLGLTLGKEFAIGVDKARVKLEPEWGFKQFIYYPTYAKPSASETDQSWAVTLDAFYYREPAASAPSAFQARVRVARDWEDSPKVGIVTPGMPPVPDVIRDSLIVDLPRSQASITPRLFYWKEVAMGSQWAIGPSVAATIAGPKGRTFSLDSQAVIRGEFWLYFMPASASPANFRIGISPYLSWYAKGQADDGRTIVPGALFQARYGAPIFVY